MKAWTAIAALLPMAGVAVNALAAQQPVVPAASLPAACDQRAKDAVGLDGARGTFQAYRIALPGRSEDLIPTTSDHKVALQQHSPTLTFSKSDK